MSAFAGAQGYENLSSAQQRERNPFGHGLAPRPSAAPDHLSRVLHIPSRAASEPRLHVHDVSAEYRHSIRHSPLGGGELIGDALMGSQLFFTRLSTMPEPTGDADDPKTLYSIDLGGDETNPTLDLRRIQAEQNSARVTISLPHATDHVKLSLDKELDMTASFPLADAASGAGSVPHSFFTLASPDGTKKWQWQVNPPVSGPLRYTLVEADDGDDEFSSRPDKVKAIYHHIGKGAPLSMRTGHGLLLLPASDADARSTTEELVVLASLLGLLWRVREMQVSKVVDGVPCKENKSFLSRLLSK
ncbi:hypothetical protein DCS_02065 [Drechmeria coniospora]|uniref:Uncharacterized protein n=1 Tax=Drechmeria coniospora TaxID=98403 RepID=A0A151GUY4_DRECN|nr:hypothetical protein DCS_02065 [Drechmeria coniospora]KYK60925.1 hypothetical protein DCS_02065 [Drechmeria coniospora]ODA83614.1 hypothetical protein RJ55_02129 [Drechmeria coniospora]